MLMQELAMHTVLIEAHPTLHQNLARYARIAYKLCRRGSVCRGSSICRDTLVLAGAGQEHEVQRMGYAGAVPSAS